MDVSRIAYIINMNNLNLTFLFLNHFLLLLQFKLSSLKINSELEESCDLVRLKLNTTFMCVSVQNPAYSGHPFSQVIK
jgi:hypothetical protein